jgi:hypothetical protein
LLLESIVLVAQGLFEPLSSLAFLGEMATLHILTLKYGDVRINILIIFTVAASIQAPWPTSRTKSF